MDFDIRSREKQHENERERNDGMTYNVRFDISLDIEMLHMLQFALGSLLGIWKSTEDEVLGTYSHGGICHGLSLPEFPIIHLDIIDGRGHTKDRVSTFQGLFEAFWFIRITFNDFCTPFFEGFSLWSGSITGYGADFEFSGKVGVFQDIFGY